MAQRGPRTWNHSCIAWALHGKCEGSAWTVRPTHRSAQLPPAHSVRPVQLNCGPRTLLASRTRGVPRIPAHFAGHAKCGSRSVRPHPNAGPCADSLANAICDPTNLPATQIRAKTTKSHYHFTSQVRNQNWPHSIINHVTFLSEQQPYQRVPDLVPSQNFARCRNHGKFWIYMTKPT